MRWFGIVRGSLEVTENSAIRQSAYELLVAFHSNYVPILHRFWHITRYWSNVTDLNLPHLYFAPRWGWLRRNFADIFGVRKLEFLRYRVAFLRDPAFSPFGTVPVCNRQTGRQTHDDSIPRQHSVALQNGRKRKQFSVRCYCLLYRRSVMITDVLNTLLRKQQVCG